MTVSAALFRTAQTRATGIIDPHRPYSRDQVVRYRSRPTKEKNLHHNTTEFNQLIGRKVPTFSSDGCCFVFISVTNRVE